MAIKNNVKVFFEVEFHPKSGSGLGVPRLVGSIPELGSWDNKKGLDAVKTEREYIWSVQVELSERSFFFFSWNCITNGKFIQKETDTGLRSFAIDSSASNGIIKTVYGTPGVNFHPHGSCRLYLKTKYHLNHNEMIGIVGAGKYLGNWNSKDAIIAEDSSCQGNWEVRVDIQAGVNAEFKWIVLDRKDGLITRWQIGENRNIRIDEGMSECRVFVPWNGTQLVIPDIKIELCSDISEDNYEPLTATIQPKLMTAPVSDEEANIQPKFTTVPVSDGEATIRAKLKAVAVSDGEATIQAKLKAVAVSDEEAAIQAKLTTVAVSDGEASIQVITVPINDEEATVQPKLVTVPVSDGEATIQAKLKAVDVSDEEAGIQAKLKAVDVSDEEAAIQPKSMAVPASDGEVFCKATGSSKAVGVISPICTEVAEEIHALNRLMANNITTSSQIRQITTTDLKMPSTDKGRQFCRKIWNAVCDFCYQADDYLNMFYI